MSTIKNLFTLAVRPPMWLAYSQWLLSGGNPLVAIGPYKAGGFKSFSHFWHRRKPIPSEFQHMLETLRRESSERAFAVDVGANIGLTSLAMAAAGFDEILAVEPIAEPASTMERNIAANRLQQRIDLRRVAAGNEPGVLRFALMEGSSEQSSVSPDGNYQVQAVTLDALLREAREPTVDFLKIDVEGHELAVLQGATATLQRGGIRFICLELIAEALQAHGTSIADVVDFLGSHHLAPCVIDGGSVVPCGIDAALCYSGSERSALFRHVGAYL